MTNEEREATVECLRELVSVCAPIYEQALYSAIKALEGPEAWLIAKDGPHKIEGTRLWLARQLVDSKHDEATALSIVAHHPAIAAAPSTPKGVTDEMVERAAKAMHDLWCPICQPWESNSEDHKNYCRNAARAALAAPQVKP